MMRRMIVGLMLILVLAGSLEPKCYGQAADARPALGRATRSVVYLGGSLSDEDLITLTSAVAAADPQGIVLLDSPASRASTKAFLATAQPERLVVVGGFPEEVPALERTLDFKAAAALPWKRGPPAEVRKDLFPLAERIVVCPSEPRGLLLQSACLAGAVGGPLFVTHGNAVEAAELRGWVKTWRTAEIFAVGSTVSLCREVQGPRIVELADTDAVAAAYLQQQLKKGPVQTFVIANPADLRLGNLSPLAAWVALRRHAALLLTNEAGDNVAALVTAARRSRGLEGADNLILLAGLQAIPMERRPNPVAGKDRFIEMEPLTPAKSEPFTFATGRLFHQDRSVVPLVMARQQLLRASRPACKALVVSNPGGHLPLLEAFSRNTARELRNRGYQTTALFDSDVSGDEVRRLLPEHDIFLWEGHYKTLVEEYGLPSWTEPLRPSLVFLQSCLALNVDVAQPLLQRGAYALVGSSSRNYSGSGGAFTLAFFDALLYEEQSLGGSLRQAKNFLICYALLKEKRLDGARLSGANLRSAWAFTLWGDPTFQPPRPEPPADALSAVRYTVHGDALVVALPETLYEKVTTNGYQAQMLPNARLAGLLTSGSDSDHRRLVPFIFAEVHLPKAPAGKQPKLRTRIPARNWVFNWDPARRCGYLLVTPRPKDQKVLRFRIEWE